MFVVGGDLRELFVPLDVEVLGDDAEEAFACEADVVGSWEFAEEFTCFAVVDGHYFVFAGAVVVDLGVLYLLGEMFWETFLEWYLSPVDAKIPVSRSGLKRGVLFKHRYIGTFLRDTL